MKNYIIMAVLINNRTSHAKTVQELFTRFGCIIKVRLGLHEIANVCSEDGLVLLELGGNEKEIQALSDQLNALEGVKAKTITLTSD